MGDFSGYTGTMVRKRTDLLPMTEDQLYAAIARSQKVGKIMRSIKDIDQDNNGYVTTTELDDILKYHMPQELSNRSLKPLFKPFASIQNRILIDYKKWKETLRKRLAEFEGPSSAK